MSDPLRARLTALVATWRERADDKLPDAIAAQEIRFCADDLDAALRAAPEGDDYASLDAARVIQLEAAIRDVLDAYGDKGWAKSEMCRRLRAALNARPNVNAARAAAPEGQ